MTLPSDRPDVLIIGAGLSGLLAANALKQLGHQVRLLEKARGVGGRMATRRLDGQAADHGAQFFTVYDPRLRTCVDSWVAAGVARCWSTGFAIPDGRRQDNGVPRYCGVGGMTAIAKHLARDLDVRLQAKTTRVEARAGSWIVTTENGDVHAARALLLTPPVPQSLALLAAAPVRLPEAVRSELEPMDYAPCLTLIARLAGPSWIPEPGGLWMPGEPLLWMADNVRKGVSPGPGSVVTIHGGQDFSREHFEKPDPEIVTSLLEAAAPWLGSHVEQVQLHRWRFSVPLRVHSSPCLALTDPAPLAFAGDAFGGPRIEAAALSGLAAAAALHEWLG